MATQNEKLRYLSELTNHDPETLKSSIPRKEVDKIFARAAENKKSADKMKSLFMGVLVVIMFSDGILQLTGDKDKEDISPKAVVVMCAIAAAISGAGAWVGMNRGPIRDVNRLVEESKNKSHSPS